VSRGLASEEVAAGKVAGSEVLGGMAAAMRRGGSRCSCSGRRAVLILACLPGILGLAASSSSVAAHCGAAAASIPDTAGPCSQTDAGGVGDADFGGGSVASPFKVWILMTLFSMVPFSALASRRAVVECRPPMCLFSAAGACRQPRGGCRCPACLSSPAKCLQQQPL
jgi:hypothetical protein